MVSADFPIDGLFKPKTDYVDQPPLNTKERNELTKTTAQALDVLYEQVGGDYGKNIDNTLNFQSLNSDVEDSTPDKAKVTPAGKFPLQKSYDSVQGICFDYLKQKGKDYSKDYSIHKTYLQYPKEKRQERFASESSQDNNISYGCINISPATVDVINSFFKENETFAYIMPKNDRIDNYFPLGMTNQSSLATNP